MRTAAVLRILGLAVAVVFAILLVQQASLLASPSGTDPARAHSRPAPSGQGGATQDCDDHAAVIPVPRPPAVPELQRYTPLARGTRFRYTLRSAAVAAASAGVDEPELPDRMGDLTLVGIMWDEAAGSGLASVSMGEDRVRIAAAGSSIGDYRIMEVGRDWALVGHGRIQRRLRPKPPILEKTRAGS